MFFSKQWVVCSARSMWKVSELISSERWLRHPRWWCLCFSLADALDSLACNHMSAVHYFINSINSSPSVIGYPCSDYKSFEDGECTSCGGSQSRCQPIGYHASLNRTLGKVYLKTLHGTKAPFFGQWRKRTWHGFVSTSDEMFLSRLSFESDSDLRWR